MKRDLRSGTFAFAPLALAALLVLSYESIEKHLFVGSSFLLQYGYGVLLLPVFLAWLASVWFVLREVTVPRWRRWIWASLALALGPIAMPVFWWLESQHSSNLG